MTCASPSPTQTLNPTASPTATATPSPTASPNTEIDCNINGENLSVTLKNSTLGEIILVAEFDTNGKFLRCTTNLP